MNGSQHIIGCSKISTTYTKPNHMKPTPNNGMKTAAVGNNHLTKSPKKKPLTSNKPTIKLAVTETSQPYSAAFLAAD